MNQANTDAMGNLMLQVREACGRHEGDNGCIQLDNLLRHKQCPKSALSCYTTLFVTAGHSCALSLLSYFLPQRSVYPTFTIDEQPGKNRKFGFQSLALL